MSSLVRLVLAGFGSSLVTALCKKEKKKKKKKKKKKTHTMVPVVEHDLLVAATSIARRKLHLHQQS